MLMQTNCIANIKKDIEFDSLSHGYCVLAITFQKQCQCSKLLKLVQTITVAAVTYFTHFCKKHMFGGNVCDIPSQNIACLTEIRRVGFLPV